MAAQRKFDVFAMKMLTRRSDFLALAQSGRKHAAKGIVVQAMPMVECTPVAGDSQIYVGYTVTKRIGKAVTRNRVKRRLREAARVVLPELAKPGWAYVLVGRHHTTSRPFLSLVKDLRYTLHQLHGDTK